MAGFDLTAAAPILKEHYEKLKIYSMVYPENPLFALMPKDDDFDGSVLPIPVHYANPQSTSSTDSTAFAAAQANASKYKRFVLQRATEYGQIYLDRQTMKATKGETGAFVKAFTSEADKIINQMVRRIAIGLYRDGNGWIGKGDGAYAVAGTAITLLNLKDITNFEVGQVLRLGATVGGAVRVGSVTVTAVNRDTGVITTNVAVNAGVTTPVNTDYIFIDGDALNGGTFGTVKVVGLDGWLPTTAPAGGDNFFGVDRSADPSRLAGVRYDATVKGDSIIDAFVETAARVGEQGGRPNKGFVNYSYWTQMERELGSRVVYETVPDADEVTTGFRSIRIMGPNGPIDIIPDQNCLSQRGYLLDMRAWKIRTLGALPDIVDEDNLEMLRNATKDGFDMRTAGYLQLGCEAPGWNGVIKLP